MLLTLAAGQFLMTLGTSVMNVSITTGAKDADLEAALDEARVSRRTTEAALDAYANARIDGLRNALAILAVLVVLALFFAQRIPSVQPGRPDESSGASAST